MRSSSRNPAVSPGEKPREASLAGLPADEAIPVLVERHGNQLYRLALRFCGSPADAEDLVQQVFLQAFRSWRQFKGDAAPTTWLYTIAARACERQKRRRAGEPRRFQPLSELLPTGERRIVDLPAAGEGALDAQLRLEAAEAVERGIARLPAKLRMALVLKDIVELPINDVARIAGVKPATIKTRVHRARLMLRAELARVLPRRAARRQDHHQRVCLDLLAAKQEALDRGVEFLLPRQDVCDRCQALFATLDLGRDICSELGRGQISQDLREALLAQLRVASREAGS